MKKIIQTTAAFLSIFITLTLLSACGEKQETTGKKNEDEVVLRYQQRKGVVDPVDLAADLGYLDGIRLESVGDYKGGPEDIQLTATGEIDFGYTFNGAIVKSVAKNVNIISVIGSYGSDDQNFVGAYALEDSEIQTPKDLIGKKIGVNILGAHYEFAIIEYLRKAGLADDEIKQVELVTIPQSNAEQALRAGQLDAVVLSGPVQDVALNRGGLKQLFSDTDVFGFHFIAGSYVFRKDFVKEHPETVKKFVEGVAKAIEWSKTTPREKVIQRFEKIIKKRNPNETTEFIQYWKSYGISSKGAVLTEKDFQVWIDWLVESGELKAGEIQARDLFTNEFNPYAQKSN